MAHCSLRDELVAKPGNRRLSITAGVTAATWCTGEDSNLHGLSTTGFLDQRVYQITPPVHRNWLREQVLHPASETDYEPAPGN